ncbi:hypothetical protein ACEPAI_7290 [Sanghuangporus weigelae]
MAEQKALILDKPHGEFSIGTRPNPKPGPGERLVEVHATALNPVDCAIRDHNNFVSDYLAVLGSNPRRPFQERLRRVPIIYARSSRNYNNQDSIHISFGEAATISTCLITATAGLYRWIDFSRVGCHPIREAFSSIIATASLHNADLLKSIGATHVIDRKSPGVSAKSLRGALIVVSRVEVDKDADKYKEKTVNNTIFSSVHIPELWELDASLLESGNIRPNRVEVLPNGLAGIPDGLDRLKKNQVGGKKIVTRPWETP